ncbi:TadG family pilus assembly protein [Pseudohoeflea coraliihabitans]|uniref:DUF2134 domain-containing protein n=1 Tax=Pseudohoeflea coraliihabitans TaxID=2860393 RepID=A0ABS6WLS3_9HYPH|nr:TadG family pilus assembly protein [Pseudohoeflea sp. DP4N28-3]MBW3096911.1 hypothetical protein [Pseudohoeflea sp. DP4N28-3]
MTSKQIRKRFLRDDAGNIAISSAVSLVFVIGAMALGVDYGAITLQNRELQAMVDTAAIQSAGQIDDAVAALQHYQQLNGTNYAIATSDGYVMPDGAPIAPADAAEIGTILTIEEGRYRADERLAIGDRFTPDSDTPDAVRITARQDADLYFGRMFMQPFAFEVSGTAAASKEASYWIGSRLASLNGGVLNAVLSGLLGTEVSLSLADYEALIDTDIDLLSFSRLMASDIGLTAATFDDLLASDVTLPQLLSAMRQTRGVPIRTANALYVLETALGDLDTEICLGDLLNLEAIGSQDIDTEQSLAIYADAMRLISAAAALSGGARQVELTLPTTLPGLAEVDVSLAIGEPANNSPVVAAGSAPVRTSQLRLLIEARTSGVLSVLGTSLHVPIYVEAAQAKAQLAAIRCAGVGDNAHVDLSVTPGLAEIAIGSIDRSKLDDFTAPLVVSKAEIVTTPVARINAIADVEIANTHSTKVSFSPADIRDRRIKTVSTSTIASSLTGSLLSSLDLEADVLGISVMTPQALLALVGGKLDSAAAPLDVVLYNTLLTLGVRVGAADVSVTGVHCGAPTLVQ